MEIMEIMEKSIRAAAEAYPKNRPALPDAIIRQMLTAAFAVEFGDEERPRYTTRRLREEIAKAEERGRQYMGEATAEMQDVARTVEAFDRDHPELYWHIAKGKITAGEPLYGAIITDLRGNELGDGESNVSAVDAFNIAIRSADLPAAPTTKQGMPLKLVYTNYRGETGLRTIIPKGIWFGATEWHPEPQWLLKAFDVEKGVDRNFALKDFGKPIAAELFGYSVLPIPLPFKVGDTVEKYTGDYHAPGEVRGVFTMKNGAIRYVVEHQAEGCGSFCHIYSEKNLRHQAPNCAGGAKPGPEDAR